MGGCCCNSNQPDSSPEDKDKNEIENPKFTPVNKNDDENEKAKKIYIETTTAPTRKISNGTRETTKEQTTSHIALTNVHIQLINVIISHFPNINLDDTNDDSYTDNGCIETKLPVMNTLTISQMKQLIHKHIGIEEHKQLLKYHNGIEVIIVDNNLPLYHYNIKDGDILDLTIIEQSDIIKINVDYKSGTIKKTIYVSVNFTLMQFRMEVQGKIPNVALNEQQFFYNNIQLTDDNKLLKDYNITNDSTLRFEWKSVC